MEDDAKVEASLLTGWVVSVGSACAQVMASPWFASVLLVSIAMWEVVVLLLQASRKRFWYDELLTLHVSGLQPFSLLWKALEAGADGMPPVYYGIVRLARMFPVDPHVALRVPSILGYMLTLLGVYLFARKRVPAFASLTGVLLIMLSPFRGYALEARSYALLVGFLAISAVLWQGIDEKKPYMTPLFAFVLTLAVSCHHLAAVAISAFGIAELTWALQSRRIRWGVWAACVVATSPFFLSLSLLLRFQNLFGKTFWARPSWTTALWTYGAYLGIDTRLALALVFFFAIVVAELLLRMGRRPREASAEGDFSLPEVLLVGGFVLYPALLAVLTRILHSAYTWRYGWPGILGLVLGSVYLFRNIWLKSSSAHLLGALLIAFAIGTGYELKQLPKADSTTHDERWAKLTELSREEKGVPVVVGSGITYLEAAEYAPPELRGRLVQIVDAEIANRLVGSDTVDKTDRLLAQFIPLRVEDLASFQAAHRKFLLHSGGVDDWLTQYLIERSYRLRLLSIGAGSSIYIAER